MSTKINKINPRKRKLVLGLFKQLKKLILNTISNLMNIDSKHNFLEICPKRQHMLQQIYVFLPSNKLVEFKEVGLLAKEICKSIKYHQLILTRTYKTNIE